MRLKSFYRNIWLFAIPIVERMRFCRVTYEAMYRHMRFFHVAYLASTESEVRRESLHACVWSTQAIFMVFSYIVAVV